MELYKELLVHVLSRERAEVSFPALKSDLSTLLEQECYKTLVKIKEILDDETLDDKECFYKIERIVRAFEESGSNGGSRHDFG